MLYCCGTHLLKGTPASWPGDVAACSGIGLLRCDPLCLCLFLPRHIWTPKGGLGSWFCSCGVLGKPQEATTTLLLLVRKLAH